MMGRGVTAVKRGVTVVVGNTKTTVSVDFVNGIHFVASRIKIYDSF
jgi:hypothetical protein